MPGLSDKTILITGATSGIGKESAISLAAMGATVLFTSRDAVSGKQALVEIIDRSRSKNVHLLLCDLASLGSVQQCCNDILRTNDRLDVLINNAGTWDFHRRESHDGIENILATNYLAPFLMTNLLLDRLRASKPARIISVTSGLHWGRMQFENLEFKKDFSGLKAYRQSKLALLLFTRLLAHKVRNDGITVNCADPGMVSTRLSRDASMLPRFIFRTFGRSPKRGAETTVFLASSDDGGQITGECFSGGKIKTTSRDSYDLDAAARLWELGERYVKSYLPPR